MRLTRFPVARIDTDAPSCWQKGEGMSTAAPGATAAHAHAYAKCIKDEGWDDCWAIL